MRQPAEPPEPLGVAPAGSGGPGVLAGGHVDRGSPVPLYFQVAGALQELITSGQLPPGTRLDNEIHLADRWGVSRPTMRKAIEYLVEQGLVVRRRGVGTQVVREKVHRPVELSSLFDDLTAAGQRPRTRVLSLQRRPVEAVEADLAELGLSAGEEVWVLERLRSTGEEPLALMRNYVPTRWVDLTEEALQVSGLYRLMRERGVTFKSASQTIGATAATAAIARLLGVPRGVPLLTMRRTAFDDRGRVLELGEHQYRADRYSFDVTLTVP